MKLTVTPDEKEILLSAIALLSLGSMVLYVSISLAFMANDAILAHVGDDANAIKWVTRAINMTTYASLVVMALGAGCVGYCLALFRNRKALDPQIHTIPKPRFIRRQSHHQTGGYQPEVDNLSVGNPPKEV